MNEEKRPRIVLFLIALFAFFALLGVVGFAADLRSEVASVEGAGIDRVITYLLVASGVILLAGNVVLCLFLWRSGTRAAYGRPSARAEWMWSLIPVLAMTLLAEAGVLVVGAPVWEAMYVEQPSDPVRLGVFPDGRKASLEVVGKQFEWFVRYPGEDGKFGRIDWNQIHGVDNPLGVDEDDPNAQDDIVVRAKLVLPVDRPVIIRLRTHDVIHSFFVPDFRVKQDLLPGFPTRIKFTPFKTGDYELACAELCGLGHYQMRATVHVETEPEFEKWLSEQETFG